MNHIEIYTSASCGYCVAAKKYLESRGLAWQETRVDLDPAARERMLTRANGRRTVPQIFINDTHVGGYDDLMAQARDGRLDQLLLAA